MEHSTLPPLLQAVKDRLDAWTYMRHWSNVTYEELGITPRPAPVQPHDSPLGDWDD